MKIQAIRKQLFRLCIGTIILLAAGGNSALAEDDGDEIALWEKKLSVGYRAFSADDNFRRAIEYTRPESGPSAELEVRGVRAHRKFYLETEYLNDSEYRAEAGLDLRGLLRLKAFGEGLFHNLDHLPYQNRPDAGTSVIFSDQDPADDYHQEVHQSGASLRAKHPRFPGHVNLAYWRLSREGSKQHRFVDEGSGDGGTGCTSCHVQSRSLPLDRVTEEVTGGFDVHAGPLNIVFEQLFRQFRDQEPVPVDTFGSHRYRAGPAQLEHDESPDSRLTKSTLKLHTSQAGGLVGALTLGIGEMESRSDLQGVRPADSETDFRNAAGDVTYTPGEHWTFNFRYRYLDLDTDNPDQIAVDSSPLSPLEVRESIDTTRAHYEGIVSWRPASELTLKGEYRREEIDRSSTGPPVDFRIEDGPVAIIDPFWELPEEETIDRFRLSAFARPLESGDLKLHAWYQYRTTDDPAYGTTAEKAHRSFAGATWSPAPKWGAQAQGRYIWEDNDEYRRFLPNETAAFSEFRLDRQKESVQAVAGFWLLPADALTLCLNYGFLYTRITQDLVFGGQPSTSEPSENLAIEAQNTDYRQKVHTASLSVAWRILEALQGRMEAQYILSHAFFDPDFYASGLVFSYLTADADSALLKQISEIDFYQTGLQIGLDWSVQPDWTISAGYSYHNYHDLNEDVFDGSAQLYTASLSRTW